MTDESESKSKMSEPVETWPFWESFDKFMKFYNELFDFKISSGAAYE